MNKIIEILMERDGMDFAGELGLEMDYIHDII